MLGFILLVCVVLVVFVAVEATRMGREEAHLWEITRGLKRNSYGYHIELEVMEAKSFLPESSVKALLRFNSKERAMKVCRKMAAHQNVVLIGLEEYIQSL